MRSELASGNLKRTNNPTVVNEPSLNLETFRIPGTQKEKMMAYRFHICSRILYHDLGVLQQANITH